MKKKILVTLVIALLATSLFAGDFNGEFKLTSTVAAQEISFRLADKGNAENFAATYDYTITAASEPNTQPVSLFMNKCNIANDDARTYNVSLNGGIQFVGAKTGATHDVVATLEGLDSQFSGNTVTPTKGFHGDVTELCAIDVSWAGDATLPADIYTADIAVTVTAN